MTFRPSDYGGLVAERSEAQARLFPQYQGRDDSFDIVVVGSGIGGGILADDLADRLGDRKRILVLEAGSYLFPTHVYNLGRRPNADVAGRFACATFWQRGGEQDSHYIHERPQLNLGGRSIFWSGLVPTPQPWELAFFPDRVRADLEAGLLARAGQAMNESVSMGDTARAIVARLRQSPLAEDFDVQETPRALHQPYLLPGGAPAGRYHLEPTGVFNTAELLANQAAHGDGPGLHLLLNHYVEDVRGLPGDRFELVARDTLTGAARHVRAGTVVLAGGSVESPKLLRRSTLFHDLPRGVRDLVGVGLTDHPTTDWVGALATGIGGVPIPRDAHAKIILYSKGRRDPQGRLAYPFNVEMNVNHEYWHLRENDPGTAAAPGGPSRVEVKFSFGNCLDDGNAVRPADPFAYVPEVVFRNQRWMDHLAGSRFPALAGWDLDFDGIFAVLNRVTHQVLSQFDLDGRPARPEGERWFGRGAGFGLGTVHHAVGTLRMPSRARLDGPFNGTSVVDEDLRVVGTRHLYACDMSVMPFSTAANPVRALAALALRLSRHFG